MRILCAVDGSDYAQWGVASLEALAEREPQHVTLLHVIDTSALKAAGGKNPIAARRAQAALEKAGARLLREAERAARVALGQATTAPRTTFHRLLAHGALASTIARQAARTRADLIVMGSRGLSDIQGFLLGSLSRQVAAVTPCPILVIKRPTQRFGQIILAVDASKQSRAAARFLRAHLVSDTSQVTILSSVDSPISDLAARYLSESQQAELIEPALTHAQHLVQALRTDFIKEGIPVSTKVTVNHVIASIVQHVEARQPDLLVLGARPLTKSERLHLGSVSESLLRHAPCSVLIVRGARA